MIIVSNAHAASITVQNNSGDFRDTIKIPIKIESDIQIIGIALTIQHQDLNIKLDKKQFDAIKINKSRDRTQIAGVSLSGIKDLVLYATGNNAGTYQIVVTNTQILSKYWGYTTKTKIPIFIDKNLRSFNPQIVNGSVILTKTCPDIKLKYFTYQFYREDIILEWKVLNANSVSLSDGVFGMGTHPPKGQYKTTIKNKTKFFLEARNDCETRQYSLVAEAPECEKPVIKTFSADKTKITEGQSIELTWSVQNVNQANISNIGQVSNAGTKILSPTTNQTYKISSENSCGKAEQVLSVEVVPKKTCEVPPGIKSFITDNPTIKSGGSATLSWEVVGAKTVSITNLGKVDSKGSTTVSPTKRTQYLMTAENDCGKATGQVWITIEKPSLPPEEPPKEEEPIKVPDEIKDTLKRCFIGSLF